MGAALLGGLVDSGVFDASALAVVEVDATRRAQLVWLFPTVTVAATVPTCAGAVLAVKPDGVPSAAAAVAEAGARRVLSIAAGVRLARSKPPPGRASPSCERCPTHRRSCGWGPVRSPPATQRRRRRGVGALDPRGGRHGRRGRRARLDAFTGVAGSGPAYVFLLAEALIEAAVEEGLDRAMAERVVRQLLLGSATLLDREGDPTRLREMVTSPERHDGGGSCSTRRPRPARGGRGGGRAATHRSRELG